MDFAVFNFIAITGICYFIGIVVKTSKIDDKWIPVICGASGAILGVVAFLLHTPDKQTASASALRWHILSGVPLATHYTRYSRRIAAETVTADGENR